MSFHCPLYQHALVLRPDHCFVFTELFQHRFNWIMLLGSQCIYICLPVELLLWFPCTHVMIFSMQVWYICIAAEPFRYEKWRSGTSKTVGIQYRCLHYSVSEGQTSALRSRFVRVQVLLLLCLQTQSSSCIEAL